MNTWRFIVLVVVALVGGVIGSILWNTTGLFMTSLPNIIEAEEFRLVDDNGNIWASLTTSDPLSSKHSIGSFMTFYGVKRSDDGQPLPDITGQQVRIRSTEAYSAISAVDVDGNSEASLLNSKPLPSLRLTQGDEGEDNYLYVSIDDDGLTMQTNNDLTNCDTNNLSFFENVDNDNYDSGAIYSRDRMLLFGESYKTALQINRRGIKIPSLFVNNNDALSITSMGLDFLDKQEVICHMGDMNIGKFSDNSSKDKRLYGFTYMNDNGETVKFIPD